MTWRRELSHYHPNTRLLLEISEVFLQQYFSHSSESAEQTISSFFGKYGSFFDESFVRGESSWGIAKAAHFCIVLGGDRGELREWEVAHGLRDTPRDALEYMREHYWSQDKTLE